MEYKVKNARWKDYLLITAGAAIYAVGVSLFLDPNNLAPGGVTGISIMVNRFVNISTGTLILVLNIPVLLLGMMKFGWRFLITTCYSLLMISIFTNLLAPFGAATEDALLAAIAGGSLVAVGIGFTFKAGATSGGTDIIVKCLRLKFKHLKSSFLFMAVDAAVVAASAIVFQNLNTAMYAGMAVFISSLVMDMVLYGRDGAKLIYIISDKPDQIAKRLLDDLGVGATYIAGSGAYSNMDKKIIMCVMRKQIAPQAEDIVKEEDKDAFMIVTSANEIFGEGYKSYFSEKL